MSIRNVIVIGAGISGLAAAIYARMAGHHVTVLEKGLTAGGVSTSWRRKGYLFEGGIHWLVGSTRKMKVQHQPWVDTGGLGENNPIYFKDPVHSYRNGDVQLHIWRDRQKLVDEISSFSPQDARAARRLAHDMFILECGLTNNRNFLTRAVMMPAFGLKILELLYISTERYIRRFHNEDVREMLRAVLNPEQNAISLIFTLMTYSIRDSGYPEGGSLRIAENMESKLESLGTRISYRTEATKVRIADGEVKGVEVLRAGGSGTEFMPADDVIVTTDTCRALRSLFDVPIRERWARKMLRGMDSEQCIFVCLGVEAELDKYPIASRLRLTKPLKAAGLTFDAINVNNYSSGRGYAPEGCTALTILLPGDSYGYWRAAKDKGDYVEKKRDVAESVIKALSEYMPEVLAHTVVTDVATPLTYERYCGTVDGGYMSVWRPCTLPPFVPGECSTVRGLHFAGFRTQLSGGLPIAVMSGRKAAMSIR